MSPRRDGKRPEAQTLRNASSPQGIQGGGDFTLTLIFFCGEAAKKPRVLFCAYPPPRARYRICPGPGFRVRVSLPPPAPPPPRPGGGGGGG